MKEEFVEILDVFGSEAELLEDMKIYKDKDRMPKKALDYCLSHGEYSVLHHSFVKIRLNHIPIPQAVHFVRHDDLKFSVKSFREKYEEFDVATPHGLEESDPELYAKYKYHNDEALELYKELLKEHKPEQARWVLPTGTTTNMVMSGRLNDIFFMLLQRWCVHADEVTAQYAQELFEKLEKLFPKVAEHFRKRCYHSTKLCGTCVREE